MAGSKTVNERLMNDAIAQLKALDLNGAESVQINHTKYDDGSTLFPKAVTRVISDIQRSYE